MILRKKSFKLNFFIIIKSQIIYCIFICFSHSFIIVLYKSIFLNTSLILSYYILFPKILLKLFTHFSFDNSSLRSSKKRSIASHISVHILILIYSVQQSETIFSQVLGRRRKNIHDRYWFSHVLTLKVNMIIFTFVSFVLHWTVK